MRTTTMAVAFGRERGTKRSYGAMRDRGEMSGSGIKTYSTTTPNVLVLSEASRKRTLEPICRKQPHTAKILAFEMPMDAVTRSLHTSLLRLVTLNFTLMQYGSLVPLELASLYLSPPWTRMPTTSPGR